MYYPEQINTVEKRGSKAAESSHEKVPDELSSAVMIACYINGGDSEDRARALEEEGGRLLALADSESPETVQTLASHLPVLEAMFLRLAKDAVICKSPSDKAKLLKASLQAQASYGRTVDLLSKLKRRTERWDTIDE